MSFLSLGLSFWLWLFCIEWWMNYDCDSYSFFSFFFILLEWSNSPIHCLPEGPCWYCDNIVKEKSKCWSPNEGKWKKWYLWWFVWFLSLESFFLFFILLEWSNSPIHCLPEWPCWYCENVVWEKSKCWSPNEGKWKKWYLWWFCYRFVVSFLRVVFLNVIIFCIEWWMNYGGSYSFFSFFFFLLGWTNSPIHCLPGGPCWYCDNVITERSKCWSPKEGKWKNDICDDLCGFFP